MRPLTIAAVEAWALRVPVAKPTRIATRLLDHRDFLLVTVTSDDGTQGVGYAYIGTRGGTVAAMAVDELLTPVLVDTPDHDRVGAWSRMYQETLLTGRRGVVLRAISAVDIAMWDLAARRAGVPLAVLLGGSTAPVPAYASGGYYKPDEGPWPAAVRREIEQNLADGFHDHKIKVGGLSIAQDAARVAAAVGVMPEGDRLALDANNAYRDHAEAWRALRAFEEAAGSRGLWWFEEPLCPDDPDGHRRLREKSVTPIATGEIAGTRWDFRALIAGPAADILQPDAGVLGGVTEYLRVAHAAELHDLPVAPHWHANLHVHLAAATRCLAVEYFSPGKDIYNFETLLTADSRLEAIGGQLIVSDRPGLGIELDPEAVERYRIRPR